jgi:hypothetical protein
MGLVRYGVGQARGLHGFIFQEINTGPCGVYAAASKGSSPHQSTSHTYLHIAALLGQEHDNDDDEKLPYHDHCLPIEPVVAVCCDSKGITEAISTMSDSAIRCFQIIVPPLPVGDRSVFLERLLAQQAAGSTGSAVQGAQYVDHKE